MRKYRIRFSKEGRAKYISHLDLVRTFQRVFVRSGLKIKHTEGFNPHPRMVFGLPLSVGCESACELMDFELENEVDPKDIPALLNQTMPEGITVAAAYAPERKLKELKWLSVSGVLEYDEGAAEDADKRLAGLFGAQSLVIQKKSKKGIAAADIAPMIASIEFARKSRTEIALSAVISAADPALNPVNLVQAICQLMPELSPDFYRFRRLEILDSDKKPFR